MQPPEPVVGSGTHRPVVPPAGIEQSPLQHEPELKQMSPVAVQLDGPPAGWQVMLVVSQKPEQHPALLVHVLPSVVQPAPGTVWHMPDMQSLLQHSPLPPHVAPVDLHAVVPQVPFEQTARLQQSTVLLHAPPAGTHMPPVSVQVCVVISHAFSQQSALMLQLPPAGPQNTGASVTPPS
jgi:hypothetical protein